MIYFISLIIIILSLYLIIYKYKKSKKLFLILSFLLVSLFQGFRSFNVGTDLPGYIAGFNNIGNSDLLNLNYQNYESGYVLFNKLVNFIGFNDRMFLLITALIINSSVFYLIYRYSKEPLLSILWYFVFGTFIVSFSAIRQCIGISIVLFSIFFVEKKKIIPFLLLILLATTFHKSCIIGLILYPIFNSKKINYFFTFKSKMVLSLIIVFLIFIFKSQFFQILSKVYYGEALVISTSSSYTKFGIYLILFILSFAKLNKTIFYRGFQNILLICTCGYAFASIHPYFTRLFYLFETTLLVFIPSLIYNLFPREKKFFCFFLNILLVSLFLLFFVGGYDTLPFSFM